MTHVVLFGVGSPLIAEYEESCRRLGWGVTLAVRNIATDSYCSCDVTIKDPDALNADDLAIPFLAPLFTPANRKIAVQQALKLGFAESVPLVNRTAIVAATTRIGVGGFINAGCVIGAEGIFGRHLIVNRASSVGHHARVGNFVSLGPGVVVAGQVSIGEGSMIGAGAVLLPQVKIGRNAVVGAGTVVAENVSDNVVVVNDRNLLIRPNKGLRL